ncbi:glycosyltransferase [Microbacterium halotolerans]|uniref:glycosyltransferase n=1 Tax=Microbacterium halotolerans TaxID=246613 RepID=UPI000E6ABA2B|nr:glycosyltransferase [Microbacterium halotolerans]
MATFPDAHYLILSSRLIPGLDGGYTIATLARAAQMAAAGVQSVRLLTFDPGTAADHAAHRAEFSRRGQLVIPDARIGNGDVEGTDALINLFDDAGADRSWLLAAVVPGERDTELEYREIPDAVGRPLLALPNVPDPSGWHLSTAPVVVYEADGREHGVVTGFGGLYRAWLEHVVAGLREGADLPVVVICESRQLGELIADWGDPGIRIVHTIHTMHVEPPFTPDAPLNPLWERWFALAHRFDAIAWPTAAQRDDVVARFGGDNHLAVPNGVEIPDEPPVERASGLVVMMNRLAPGKRIDHTIRAFVAADVPGTRLDIYGDGPERARLQALIDEAGAGDRVALRGATTAPGAVLEAAELFVTSTEFEGQGLAIVEALAHGCPVVTYDIRYGPADALAAGGGALVPSGDERALAGAIRSVMGDEQLRVKLAREAPDAARRWSTDAAMDALASAIRHAVASPPRR